LGIKDFLCEYSSIIVDFNDVDDQYFWVWIIGGNKVVKGSNS
jgi:hypothetical protein